MNKMKKLLALLLALTMVFALAACGGSAETADREEETVAKRHSSRGAETPAKETEAPAEETPEPTPEPTHARAHRRRSADRQLARKGRYDRAAAARSGQRPGGDGA